MEFNHRVRSEVSKAGLESSVWFQKSLSLMWTWVFPYFLSPLLVRGSVSAYVPQKRIRGRLGKSEAHFWLNRLPD